MHAECIPTNWFRTLVFFRCYSFYLQFLVSVATCRCSSFFFCFISFFFAIFFLLFSLLTLSFCGFCFEWIPESRLPTHRLFLGRFGPFVLAPLHRWIKLFMPLLRDCFLRFVPLFSLYFSFIHLFVVPIDIYHVEIFIETYEIYFFLNISSIKDFFFFNIYFILV